MKSRLKTPKSMHKNKSVIYVNYSPYENSGHILDYLNEKFDKVFLYSIAFHPLGGKSKLNKITHFEKGKIKKEVYLYYLPIHPSLVWIMIPIRSIVNALQMFIQVLKIYRTNGKMDCFFTVNAFAEFIGMCFKKVGLVGETVFWVWDYYPINHPNPVVRLMRWMYWQFDKIATHADRVVYLNKRLVDVKTRAGMIPRDMTYLIAPIGTGKIIPSKKKDLKKIKIGFIGVLKKSQGLDMLVESARFLYENFENLSFEIIGSGPDEEYFKKRVRNSPVKFNFYGLVSEKNFRNILINCTIGIAPYTPEDSNVSRFGDPGKVKRYLEFNLPTIITNVFEFSKELEKSGAGIIVKYGDKKELTSAIKKIVSDYGGFRENILSLNKKFYYRNIYHVMFGKE